MYRPLSSIRSLVVIACMAMAVFVVFVFERVRSTITAAWTWLRDVSPIALKQPKPKCHPALVQAKAFVMRQAKRDRPTVMARWRMCPSI